MTSKYLCAFLQPNDRRPPLLGSLDIKTSNKEVDASLFLYHLLFYSPNPWKLEQEYLEELRKISDSANEISKTCCGSQRMGLDLICQQLMNYLPSNCQM